MHALSIAMDDLSQFPGNFVSFDSKSWHTEITVQYHRGT